MQTHIEACDIWDAVEEDYEFLLYLVVQQSLKKSFTRKGWTRKSKAKVCLYVAHSSTTFSKMMLLESTKIIWDFLKEEYLGGERINGMKVIFIKCKVISSMYRIIIERDF